jgi:hypothetical protein
MPDIIAISSRVMIMFVPAININQTWFGLIVVIAGFAAYNKFPCFLFNNRPGAANNALFNKKGFLDLDKSAHNLKIKLKCNHLTT